MNRTAQRCRILACLALIVVSAVWLIPAGSALSAEETSAAINQAENDLTSAYTAVVEAETAGADVSALLNPLQSAGAFLSQAYVAFKTADYERAHVLAAECARTLGGVAEDAATLKANAEKARFNKLLLSAVVSSVGLILFLFIGLLGWKFLKKRYINQALNLKPEAEVVN
ncbi:MAG: hypothetical protein NWE94_07395 [Candidatus Bathyarchaeota archaeon]|nr:hypothetical protein [Candidatus Bathyarchaeota archaeon]